MALQKNSKKVGRAKAGRPKLPRGVAKGRIVPVRFTEKELQQIEAAAKKNALRVSQWIRNAVHLAMPRGGKRS